MSSRPSRLAAGALLLLLCLAAVPAPAAEAPPAPLAEYRPAAGSDSSLGWETLRMLGGLAGVLGLLLGGAALLRRWTGPGGPAAGGGLAQIVGRLPLTPKEAVCLVQVGGEILVLGVSAAGVTLLHRLAAETLEERPGNRLFRPEGRPPAAERSERLWSRIREVQSLWGLGRGGR